MQLLRTYILPRIAQWAVVIFVGVTLTFLIPRFSPINPIDDMISRMTAFQTIDPEAVVRMRANMEDLYGLGGTLLEQYLAFWKRLLQGDLGPSFQNFPTPVAEIIGAGIPWTVGLLTTATILSWLLGIFVGSLVGYNQHRRWAQALERVVIVIYPMPYLIIALVLLVVFAFYWPLFPMVGGAQGTPALTWDYISSIFRFGFLPALSIVIGGFAFRFIIAKALATTEISSDYVQYAELAAVPKRRIVTSYVIRNTMLPHVNDLALSLGAMFEGALITEVMFGYPGVGSKLFTAISVSDYNVIMGITLLSIVGIATGSLIVDLLYPVFDPRVRLR
ncbi:MAG: ABC transporter permease [Chloroflexota bacterium]|nr:ABC transporter permease [Chloroflexota bacterium]MDE2952438.1 ABC transporter permease [Chloroflexota bacterium]